jgi:radical SAM superfamily enzyme YgiQ (UPF0313 family)
MRITKAFLIYPPTGMYMRDDRCQAPVEGLSAQPMRTPLDLAYMAGSLESAGIQCKVKDYPSEKHGWASFRSDLEESNPDMLVISVTTPTLKADMAAAGIARRFRADILVVTKGAHNAAKDEEVLDTYKDIDVVIRGESELAVAEIALAESLDNVRGISFRKNGRIVRTQPRPFLEDLDNLPKPARHLLNNSLYLTPDTREPLTVIYTARGCPYQCVFCAVPLVSGNRIVQRSPLSIVNELEECVREYGIRNFFFRADTFTFHEDWVIEICRLIVERNLCIRWGTNSRVTTLSDSRLAWMKRAGCWVIGLGIESGSQKSLDLMKKNADLQDARTAVTLCRKHGIRAYTLLLIGFPWDTKETVRETIAFSKALDGDYLDMNIVYPLPGTELYDIARKRGLLKENAVHGFDYSYSSITTERLSTNDLMRLRRLGLLSFYARPRYVLRTLLSVKSIRELRRYLFAGIALVFRLYGRKGNVVEPDGVGQSRLTGCAVSSRPARTRLPEPSRRMRLFNKRLSSFCND